jgi:hypothetical protein
MRTRWLGALLTLCCLAPPLWADEPKKPDTKTYQVPYTLSPVKHVIVRAKINGKGPFHFILDTGAPALFLSTKAAKQLGVEKDKKGWGTFDRFEIEGGVVIEKAKGVIDDPFQLEGMNGLGLAGVELHGVIGFNILAKYRIELDFAKTKMTWTPLDWEPPALERLGGSAGSAGGLEVIATLMKFLGGLLGKKGPPELVPRGFLGLEVENDSKGVLIKSVLASGPAAMSGLKPGDRITEVDGRTTRGSDDVYRLAGKHRPGEKVTVTVQRGGKDEEITVKMGEGL